MFAPVQTADGNNPNIQDLVAAANRSRAIDEEKGQKFKANLIEIAQLPSINTAHGPDLKAILEKKRQSSTSSDRPAMPRSPACRKCSCSAFCN